MVAHALRCDKVRQSETLSIGVGTPLARCRYCRRTRYAAAARTTRPVLYYYGIIGAVRLEKPNLGTHVMVAGYAVEYLVGLGHEPFGLGCAAAYAPQVAEMYPVDIFAYVAYVDVVCTQTLVCGCRKFFMRPVYCVTQLQGLSLGERDVARTLHLLPQLLLLEAQAGDGSLALAACKAHGYDGVLRCVLDMEHRAIV